MMLSCKAALSRQWSFKVNMRGAISHTETASYVPALKQSSTLSTESEGGGQTLFVSNG